MDLREIVLEGVDWSDLAQDRDLCEGSCEHDSDPSGSINGGEFLDWMSVLLVFLLCGVSYKSEQQVDGQ
jgi:hypothetical protein